MGRVDEAMRRAAAAAETVATPPASGYDVETLAAEPFPPEEPQVADAEPETPRFVVEDDQKSENLPLAPAEVPPAGLFSFEGFTASMTGKVVTDAAMQPASREQYRKLAAALHAAQRANGIKIVMIASAVAGEGKTLTASNLALTLSESYQRKVLLVDGDLRRPSLHTLFQFDGARGLTDCLGATDDRRLPLHRLSEKLTVLGAGRPSSDPMAGLTSDRMRLLIEEAREVFDWVIIDTPPVGLLTDANLLSGMVDAALLVVKADTTPYFLVQRAIDAIDRERLLGVVLNQATQTTPAYGYQYYNAYYSPNGSKGLTK